MNLPAPQEFEYTLLALTSGEFELLQGDETMWGSAEDEQFEDEFPGARAEPSSEEVIAYLRANDYLPPGIEPDVIADFSDPAADDEDEVCDHGLSPEEFCEECDGDEDDDEDEDDGDPY